MSGYKTFAVAGAGGLGKHIIEGLLAKKDEGVISSAIVLSRSAGGYDDLVAKGAKIVAVDYSSQSSIKSALTGVDVVISTLGGGALENQERLAVGAKAAGVKLFVPSEFGNQTDGATEGVWLAKDNLKRKLKDELKLPFTIYYTGGLADLTFSKGKWAESVGFDIPNGRITIQGIGDAPISFTTRHDVGRFVAYSLTALPRERIEWGYFRIEGDRASFNKIAEDFKARSRNAVTISHRPRSEVEEAKAKYPDDFIPALLLGWDQGDGVSGKPEEITNGDFPDWRPKKVVNVLLDIYG